MEESNQYYLNLITKYADFKTSLSTISISGEDL